MKNVLKSSWIIVFILYAAAVAAQNGAYSSYYSYTITPNPNGTMAVIPTAEVTGIDDVSDWIEGQYRPVCTVRPKIQLTGDAAWVGGTRVALGRAVDQVRTGQAVYIPDGSTVNIQFAVEADVSCSGAPSPSYYLYPTIANLNSWADIDPNIWALVGFEPAQTNPPYWIQYCSYGNICPVAYGVASIRNFVDFADFLSMAFQFGYDHIWYYEPLGQPPLNKCIWSSAPNCRASGVAQPSILVPFVYPCWDSTGLSYVSVLDNVPWVEVQIGGNVYGAVFADSVLDTKSGSMGPPDSCWAAPPHLGVW